MTPGMSDGFNTENADGGGGGGIVTGAEPGGDQASSDNSGGERGLVEFSRADYLGKNVNQLAAVLRPVARRGACFGNEAGYAQVMLMFDGLVGAEFEQVVELMRNTPRQTVLFQTAILWLSGKGYGEQRLVELLDYKPGESYSANPT